MSKWRSRPASSGGQLIFRGGEVPRFSEDIFPPEFHIRDGDDSSADEVCNYFNFVEDLLEHYKNANISPIGECYTLPNGECIGRGCMHDTIDVPALIELVNNPDVENPNWHERRSVILRK